MIAKVETQIQTFFTGFYPVLNVGKQNIFIIERRNKTSATCGLPFFLIINSLQRKIFIDDIRRGTTETLKSQIRKSQIGVSVFLPVRNVILRVSQIITFAVFIRNSLDDILWKESDVVTRKTAFSFQIVVVSRKKFGRKRNTRTDEFVINPKCRVDLIVERQPRRNS